MTATVTEYIKPPDEPDESTRAAQVFALSTGIPLYTRDFGWVEVLAAAGLTDALGELVEAQRIQALHALHAEVELAPRFFLNPALKITDRDTSCLLLAYELEAEVIMASPLASHHLEKWLNERSHRAAEYRYLVVKFTGPWWTPFNCHCATASSAHSPARVTLKPSSAFIKEEMLLASRSLMPSSNAASIPHSTSRSHSALTKRSLFLKPTLWKLRSSGNQYTHSTPVSHWLSNRTKRAVQFFNAYANAYWESHSSTKAIVPATDSQAAAPVKWPDKLYDFEGVSTSPAYRS